MTPEEKAWELFVRFNKEGLHQISSVINRFIRKEMIKQCALIAVDEILKYQDSLVGMLDTNDGRDIMFWEDVKQEIEKL